jgi:glucose-1-phosphate thymidylyltransferase
MSISSYFRKGIILAGGSGTRLYPLTRATSKQLLPIYDKPMVYYPLSVLMLAGIRQVLLISTPEDIGSFRRLFGDGRQIGMTFEYAVQPRPEGLAQAFILGREFIGRDHCALVLGDNVLHGSHLSNALRPALERDRGATIFGYKVDDPRRYGVVEFDGRGKVVSLEEKPARPRSTYAVPGIYFYDNQVVDIAGELKPSARGELEITDLNRAYLKRGELHVERLDDGFTWLDAGTHASLLEAAQFVQTSEARYGAKVGCIEEIAFRHGFIDEAQFEHVARSFNNEYGEYLLEVLRGRIESLRRCG